MLFKDLNIGSFFTAQGKLYCRSNNQMEPGCNAWRLGDQTQHRFDPKQEVAKAHYREVKQAIGRLL